MLNTSIMEKMYEDEMGIWLHTHVDQDLEDDRCDMCGVKSTGILYNVPGTGCEMLVCYSCYIHVNEQTWRES